MENSPHRRELLPQLTKEVVEVLHYQIQYLGARTKILDARMMAWPSAEPDR